MSVDDGSRVAVQVGVAEATTAVDVDVCGNVGRAITVSVRVTGGDRVTVAVGWVTAAMSVDVGCEVAGGEGEGVPDEQPARAQSRPAVSRALQRSKPSLFIVSLPDFA